tara:strand:- start:5578 stop:6885 length:1308 start_codon:yes stop_codon:yes gene_type:complete
MAMTRIRRILKKNKQIEKLYRSYFYPLILRRRQHKRRIQENKALSRIKNLKLKDSTIYFKNEGVTISISPFYNNYKGCLVISSDFELNWGGRFSNSLNRDNYGFRTRLIFDHLIEILDLHNVPVTWATVGHLFLESCQKGNSLAHERMSRPTDFYKNKNWVYGNGDWYSHDPCTNLSLNPEWYGRDLIDKLLNANVNHEIGCHSFSHIDFSSKTTDAQLVDCEIKECIKLANDLSIKLKSFVFPGNFEGHHDILCDYGFTSYRGYGGLDTVIYPEKKHGMWNIHQSLIIKPSDKDILKEVKIHFDSSVKNNGVCHLWFHPFELNQSFLEDEFTSILDLINEYRPNMWITTMEKLADYMENRQNLQVQIVRSNDEIRINPQVKLSSNFSKIPLTALVTFPPDFRIKARNGEKHDPLQERMIELTSNTPITFSRIRN